MATGARPYRGNAARQEVAKPASRANNALIVIAGGLFTIALALMLLMLASAQPGVVFGPDQATRSQRDSAQLTGHPSEFA